MIHPHSINSDQKQVRSLAGQASGVCYALVPGHHGQGGRHGPVVGELLDFADRLLSNCLTTIVPSLELAGGFGSRSFWEAEALCKARSIFNPSIRSSITSPMLCISSVAFRFTALSPLNMDWTEKYGVTQFR